MKVKINFYESLSSIHVISMAQSSFYSIPFCGLFLCYLSLVPFPCSLLFFASLLASFSLVPVSLYILYPPPIFLLPSHIGPFSIPYASSLISS
ncbi:hypothetical protein BZA77DRAFT_316263 [Pyronema omphalodes]|nr:hypothetical protein BZA77DRAFT_316263 [Pyronema omphalodes]